MSSRSLLALTAVALVLTVPESTRAQAAEQAPLTLEAALELALKNNEVPGIARARLEQARALTREAWARLLPEVVLQGTYTRRPRAVERDVGGTPTVIQSANGLAAVGSVRTSILDAPAIPLVLRTQRLEQAQAHEGRALVQDLLFDAAEAYYGVLSAEELQSAAERRVEVARTALEVARRRLEAGLTGRQEVTRSELELSTARLARQDARLLVATNRLALGVLLGVRADMPLIASDGVAPAPATVPEGLVRPDVLARRAALSAAEVAEKEPWLRLVPSLDALATFRTTNEPGLAGDRENWSISATATWVLYDGGLRYAALRARRAEADERRLELSALERTAVREREEAELRTQAAAAAVEEAEVATRIARENASEVDRLFAAGLATALERADATVASYEAEAALARQRFALRVARLAQRRAVGMWPTAGVSVPEVAP